MTLFAQLALVAWIPFSILLFTRLTPRRALLVSFIGGWLFLPLITIVIPGPLPDLTKLNVLDLSALVGILLVDRTAFLRFRHTWLDVPMLVWVLSPFLSSLSNGLGVYDGLAAVLEQLLVWGIPYWLGRIYFSDAAGLRELATGLFIGGLAYIPFCWYEIFRGPNLHYYIYGPLVLVDADAFYLGAWRPTVFMNHTLMVASWMATASVSGLLLFLSGGLARWGRKRSAIALLVLIGTLVALRSVNVWFLLPFVLAVLLISIRVRRAWLLWGTVAVLIFYLALRTSGVWDALEFQGLMNQVLPSKTNSVTYRIVNEIQIGERARLQPLWGWGRWGRAFIGRPGGLTVTTPDSLWILAFGQQGTVGLVAILFILFLPPLVFSLRVPPAEWLSPAMAPVTACAFLLYLFALDCMVNAMLIPLYIIAMGGIGGWCNAYAQAHPRVAHMRMVAEK